MWVLKLGGSLLEGGELHAWLEALPALSEKGLLVVPGGGPFADCVREWQLRSRASERTAHGQALLAMQQMARIYLQHCPVARPWRLEVEGASALRSGGLWIWLPDPDMPLPQGLEANWRTTSDSLSLALAGQIGAQGLMLVKAQGPDTGMVLWSERVPHEGLVDEAFDALQQLVSVPVWWLGPLTQAQAHALIAPQSAVDCRLNENNSSIR